ncbi:NYN domain-containing protein [Agathobacter sp.]
MCEKQYPEEFSARVYKIGRDDRGSRLTFLKITGGSLKVRDKVEYSAHGSDGAQGLLTEKIDQIRKYSGEKFDTADTAEAGEVVAVTGLSSTFPGQGLGGEMQSNMPILEPVLNYRMILPDDVNPAAFMEKLKQLEEEDPQLYIVWVEEFKEIHVQLMGQVQMEVLVRLIKDRFGVVVTFGQGSIVYKETIAKTVEGVGHFEPLRHYAEVHLLLSPAERGSGITVTSTCSEDVLDKNWQRLIATHVEEKEHRGVLTGSALTDVKVTILTGRAHVKHTEGGDFRQATYRAIRQGLKSTESVLLEPYYSFILQVPMEYVGRAMTDLEQRSAKAEGPEFSTNGTREMATITGKAPVATMQDYVSLVHAYTKGLGHLTLELWGYDECHNPAEVIEKMHYDSEEDFRNPTGSVFCAHGSGYVVPWDEVPQHMHLPYVYDGDDSDEALEANARTQSSFTAEDAEALAGNRRRASWEKEVSRMSSVELDAQLADVYAREFGMSKNDVADQERRKWSSKKKNEYEGLSGKPRTVKHDKHGNPIYPKKAPDEEYLIVDGYNIIFAWDDLRELSRINIDSARDKLKDILSDYQGYRGCRLILVFDAYKVRGNEGKHETFHNIEVVYTRQDETADAFIEKTVFGVRDKYKVTVATSDGLEQQTVMSLGALRMSARELREHIEMTRRAGLDSL